MNKIDFLCVGVQKAGTTTLHNILSQHPDLCLPEKKETHFFSDSNRFKRGVDYYFSNFKNFNEHKFIGEIDPEYSYSNEAPQRIFNTFGKIKIIILLRNPLDRAYSHYLMTKRRGIESLDFEKAIKIEKERIKTEFDKMHFSYISRGLYLDQINNYEKTFGVENIKILLFEDFISNDSFYINEVSNFIGLSNFNYETNLKSNPAAEPRIKALQKVIYKDNSIKRFIGKAINSKERKRKIAQYFEKMNLKKKQNIRLSQELKKKIFREYYFKEVELLEEKLKMDLSRWRQQ